MRVQLLSAGVGRVEAYPGEVVDVDPAVGAVWVAEGLAVPVHEAIEAALETAAQPNPPERTVRRRGRG